MEFKVGDKVKILNTEFGNKGKIGIIETISGTTMIYFVKLDGSCNCQWSDASDLELVEEEKVVAKVGDKVQINELGVYCGSCGIVTDNQRVGIYSHKVIFEDGDWSVFTEKDLIVLSTEEEKVMKFKVGDKVKVSNSWEGRSGEVGEITRRNIWEAYPCRVTFEDGVYESFREEEIELVKEKQSFTKSDLKTGMGVVLRNGDKGHVLLGTDDGDMMRFLEKDTWDTLDSTNEDLTWKGSDKFDIVEVYSTKLASRYLTNMVFEAKCVFKREEPTKMTMKEINEHFGKPIEIVE